jgi:hypothetical protein
VEFSVALHALVCPGDELKSVISAAIIAATAVITAAMIAALAAVISPPVANPAEPSGDDSSE